MLVKPFIGAAASGKLGGVVASHNAGGQYYRAYVVPTDPRTPRQAEVRSILSLLSALWTNTLTQAQRDGWTAYAAQVTFTNRLGDPIHISGMPCYVRINTIRLQGGLARVDDAPPPFSLTPSAFSLQPFSNFVAGPPSTIDVGFDNTDAWATAVGGALMVYASAPKNITVNFFKGGYQLAAVVPGAVVAPTSPATVTLPITAVAGQRLFLKIVTTQADGRQASPLYFQFDT